MHEPTGFDVEDGESGELLVRKERQSLRMQMAMMVLGDELKRLKRESWSESESLREGIDTMDFR